jgi:hypothetical protein
MTRRELLATAACGFLPPPHASRVIFIELAGGPSQSDTFDLETGPWMPHWMDPVTVAGIRFPAGLMPRLAGLLDRVTLVRGIEAPCVTHRAIELGCEPLRASAASFPEACRHALRSQNRLVHIRFGSWDHHGNLYEQLRVLASSLDEGLASLITSQSDARIIAMGEFGRRPGPLNQNGGRDHYIRHAALLAGPGMVPAHVLGRVQNRDILRFCRSPRS